MSPGLTTRYFAFIGLRAWDLATDRVISTFQLVNNTHGASLTHEALGGAAAFYAARKYEEHVAENGPPPNHALAKELL